MGIVAGPLLLIGAACGGGSSDDENPFTAAGPAASETTATTDVLPCAESRHVVAFDIIGLLTLGDYAALSVWDEQGVYPDARPGTAETANAYRQRGFEVLYITTMAVDTEINGVPSLDAMISWLTEKGFPMEPEVTRVWAMDNSTGTAQSWGHISNELLRLAGDGAIIDAAYTENADKAYGFATGGVPKDGLFTLESVPVEGQQTQTDDDASPLGPPNTPIAGDDFVAHAAQIGQEPPICQL